MARVVTETPGKIRIVVDSELASFARLKLLSVAPNLSRTPAVSIPPLI
jgi:hypothetical protein